MGIFRVEIFSGGIFLEPYFCSLLTALSCFIAFERSNDICSLNFKQSSIVILSSFTDLLVFTSICKYDIYYNIMMLYMNFCMVKI